MPGRAACGDGLAKAFQENVLNVEIRQPNGSSMKWRQTIAAVVAGTTVWRPQSVQRMIGTARPIRSQRLLPSAAQSPQGVFLWSRCRRSPRDVCETREPSLAG